MTSRTNDTTLAALTSLGFGPDACLMRDPRLFVDTRFLGALILEFADELGPEEAARSLFQIGLLHGLRDAQRASGALFDAPLAVGRLHATPLAIRFEGCRNQGPGIALDGFWPERHESSAWIARLGNSDAPVCHLSSGYTSGWLSGTMEADILALEGECVSCGDVRCGFEARELSHWQRHADPRAEDRLGGVPMATYRQVAAATLDSEPDEFARASAARLAAAAAQDTTGDFDPAAPVVHIWGPVMVLPFTSPDEALHAVDLLSRDPSTGEVRAVVLDLRDTVVDEAFGIVALEQVLEIIELWGAEALITGVSAFSEAAVADCEVRHLLVRKDLSEAIATAFQIADAQRFSL